VSAYLKVFVFSITLLVFLIGPYRTLAAEYEVYDVRVELNMGNVGEKTRKDYLINMGDAQGLRLGHRVKVFRKIATFDIKNRRLLKDMAYPFAILKVIHVEHSAAITRLEKYLPLEDTPIISPPAIAVGDLVTRIR